nr:MAG TPA: hypothetical protein [Caudoviricetes sp.]
MIELKVEDYCQNCSEFKPDVNKEFSYADDEVIYSLMTVFCENASKCKRIYECIKKEDLK